MVDVKLVAIAALVTAVSALIVSLVSLATDYWSEVHSVSMHNLTLLMY